MVRVKTNARREAFLAAAAEVFQEMSFDQASMDVIAAKVGSSKATLYRYFKSKEALFTELIHRSASDQGGNMMSIVHTSGGVPADKQSAVEAVDTLGLLNPDEDIRLTLTRFGEHVLETFHTPQSFAVQRMVIAASVSSDVGKTFYEQGPARAIVYLQHYFAPHIQAGRLRQADPHVVACHYFGLLQAEVYQAGLFNVVTALDKSTIPEIVARAIDVFMRAYG